MANRLTTAAFVLIAAAAGCAARTPFATPLTSNRFFVAGYHPYWAGDAWQAYPLDAITELYFFEIEAAGDGTFLDRHGWPATWRAMVERALAAGVQVTPTIAMHDADAFETLFANPAAAARLSDSIVALFDETPRLAGAHIDFEVFRPVTRAARDGFTSFITRLGPRVRSLPGRPTLSVFALAFDDDDAYDEREIAAASDYVVVQGYDFHDRGGQYAGPVGAVRGWGRLNWDRVVARFDSLGVPARKLVMAVPLYGYQWPTESDSIGARTRGVGVNLPLTAPPDVLPELPRASAQAARHGFRRDPVSGTPYYAFQDSTGWHQGWFEDTESLRAKYDFVRRRGLGGIALFPMAYGDATTWATLRDAWRAPRGRR